MARIRTIKPEFWDSPSTAKASPWARLLFIAMWNWADDYGRGTANLKEMEGFAFPHDDAFTDSSGNTVHFRSLVAEVSECFGVVFYEVDKRPYYEIPTWDLHQRNERRSKQSKYPAPNPDMGGQEEKGPVAEIPCNDTETPNISGAGTGEQGNRGTGDKESVSDKPKPRRGNNTPEHRATDAAYEATGKAFDFIKVRAMAKWMIHERLLDEPKATQAIVDTYRAGKPITKTVLGQLIDGYNSRSSNTTSDRMNQTMLLAQELEGNNQGAIEQ